MYYAYPQNQGSHKPQTPPPVLPPGGYFKHTSFSCRYVRRDIICNDGVINIQHTHCGLVGPEIARSGPERPLPATGVPTCQA